MNSRVKAVMFNKPFNIKIRSDFDSKGDPTKETSEIFNGYLQEKIKTVVNEEGKEETSRAQIFLDGKDILKYDTECRVSYDTVTDRRIIKMDIYYLNGVPDYGLLYLA